MMREERTPKNVSTCPACKSPVDPGDRFCEICGEKIPPPPAQAPVCRSCGTPLLPNARFCENCGDPVKTTSVPAPAPVPVAPGIPPAVGEPALPRNLPVIDEPVPEIPQDSEADPGLFEDSGPEIAPAELVIGGTEPEEEPEPEEESEAVEEPETEPEHGPVDELLLGLEPEESYAPEPEKPPARAAATMPEKPAAVKAATPKKGGFSKKTFLAIGLVAAIIVIAVAVVGLLPVLTGHGSPATSAPALPATPAATATTVVTTEPTQLPTPVETETAAPALAVPAATPAASDTTEQVDNLPPQYTLHFEVFKDVVTGDATVTVTGPSRNVVKDIEVTVFHPDGTTDSDHLIPSQGMTEVTVTGTRSSERVVVTVLFYSGEQYKLIDRIVSFSRRT